MSLERDMRMIFGAYEYLRSHDIVSQSTTSRLLHDADLSLLAGRGRDELEELRGAVAGTHGHGHGRDDIVLEAYQTLYWFILLAVAAGDQYEDIRPHEAPLPSKEELTFGDLSAVGERRRLIQTGIAVASSLCLEAGVTLLEATGRDLKELRDKSYLAAYWETYDNAATA